MTKFFVIPLAQVTTRMLNASTSRVIDCAIKNPAGDKVMLESNKEDPDTSLLSFPMYYIEEARELINSGNW